MDLSAREITLQKRIRWRIKEEINFDPKTENFCDYLKKEKIEFDRTRPLNQLLFVGFVLIVLLLFLILESLLFINYSFALLEDKPIGPETLRSPEFSLLLVISTLATVLGLILSIMFIIFKYLLTKAHWSRFHNQTLALFERLDEAEMLDNYITLERKKNNSFFTLTKISIDFQIQWIFPFIFDGFPPLLIEISLISFLLPFSVSTLVSLVTLFFAFDFPSLIIIIIFLTAIALEFYTSINSISRSWSKYIWIRNLMIIRQQEIIHELILKQADNLEILMNEQNMSRLESMYPFPLPAIIRISTVLPLLGSFIGYLIGLIIIT